MTLTTNHIEKSLAKLNLSAVSFVITYFAALLYPHIALGAGVMLDGKTVIMIFFFMAFALYCSSKYLKEERLIEKTPVFLPVGCLTVIVIFAAIFAQNRPIALEALALYVAYIFCFCLFFSFLKSIDVLRFVAYTICFLLTVLSIYGLFQYYTFNLNPELKSVWRLRSTFGNCDHFSGYLAMGLPFFLGVFYSRRRSDKVKIGLVLVLISLFLAQVLTYARMGWIASTVGVAIFFILQTAFGGLKLRKVIVSILPFVILVVCMFLSSSNLINRFNTMIYKDTESTLYGRKLAWKGTIEMIKENAVTGIGPGNYSKTFRQYEPPGLAKPYLYGHSDYLHFTSELGVMFIPTLVWLLIRVARQGVKKIKLYSQEIVAITSGAMGGVGAILVYSISDYNLHIPGNTLLFIVLTAIIVAPLSKSGGKHHTYSI
jgi:O-antigen ligase